MNLLNHFSDPTVTSRLSMVALTENGNSVRITDINQDQENDLKLWNLFLSPNTELQTTATYLILTWTEKNA